MKLARRYVVKQLNWPTESITILETQYAIVKIYVAAAALSGAVAVAMALVK
jgi:hypothetical protein